MKKWRFSEPVRLALNAVGLMILVGLAIYLEVHRERTSETGGCDIADRENTDKSASTYRSIAASGYRNVRSRRVTLIAFKDGVDPGVVLTNVCEQRRYAATLIPQLIAAGAAAIVFDKFFGPDSCDPKDPGTSDLISAVAHSNLPIVVGIAMHSPKSDPNNVCLIADKSLDFGKKVDSTGRPTNQPAVHEGLIRLNRDPKKVPLNWFHYPSDEAFKAAQPPSDQDLKTLSWVTATLLDKDLQHEPAVKWLTERGLHPYTSFISPAVFSHADAPAILCNSPAKDEIVKRYNVNCALYPPPERADLLGRIIVIGDDVEGVDRNDLFPDQPQVPGMYLQANYIESLLDGRYLRPFGAGWNFTILAAWVVFLYLIFWIQPEVALAASLAVAYLVKLLVIQLVLWKGLYPQIWVGELGVVAILLKYIDSRGHRVVHAIEEWREDRHRQHRKRKPKAKN